MYVQFFTVFIISVFSPKDVPALSIDIFPITSVEKIAGEDMTITATIQKTEGETWFSFVFMIAENIDEPKNECFLVFSSTTNACSPRSQCAASGFDFSCNYTHFVLTVNDISVQFNKFVVQGRLSPDGNEDIFSHPTTIYVRVPLNDVLINPSGDITMKENDTVNFLCSAISFPKPWIIWSIQGTTPSTTGKPTGAEVVDSETGAIAVTSNITYIAQKSDNGKSLMCTGSDGISNVNSSAARLNIHFTPRVEIYPDETLFKVIENDTNVNLTCLEVEANPPSVSYQWYKNGSPVSQVKHFVIKKVQKTDSGNYSCSANNTVGSSKQSELLELDVLYGVDMNAPLKLTSNEGSNISVTCSGQSNPVITDNDVFWTKQNNTTFRQNGTRLIIPYVTRQDKGVYLCVATVVLRPSNGVDQTIYGRSSLELDVLYVPLVEIFPKDTVFQVKENDTNVNLTCKVTEANPLNVSYHWYKNGIQESISSKHYVIKKLKRTHAGNYSCSANNSVGDSKQSAVLALDVLYGIDMNTSLKLTSKEGSNVSVTCSGQSNPVITDNDVFWTKQDNTTFRQNGTRLIIPYVTRQDKGVYICIATVILRPSVGDDLTVYGRSSLDLDVIYVPNVELSPKDTVFQVIENDTNVNMTCEVTEANPPNVSYQWYKNGIQESISSKLYVINKLKRTDAGNYSCSANNSVGDSKQSAVLVLDVLYGVDMNASLKLTSNEGSNVSVTCTGQSNPVITDNDVFWTKQDNTTFRQNGKRIIIPYVTRQDKGVYICVATVVLRPSNGDVLTVYGRSSLELDILYVPNVEISPKEVFQVIENDTDVNMTCKVTESNPPTVWYQWYKNGIQESQSSQNYVINKVKRTHSGNYSCTANNSVGDSKQSAVLMLDVLYAVSLNITESVVSVNESENWQITCIASGNPIPSTFWTYYYNNSILNSRLEGLQNRNSLKVLKANCNDTGIYVCRGYNMIGGNASQSTNITVNCAPRYTHEINDTNIYIRGQNEKLSINATFISYPPSQVEWYRQLSGSNLTQLKDDNFSVLIEPSRYPYVTLSVLQKNFLADFELGDYIAKASNEYGEFMITYHVKAKRAPDMPMYMSADCFEPGKAKISWRAGFNGGEKQYFQILYSFDKTLRDSITYQATVQETNDRNHSIIIPGLSEGSTYFIVHSFNAVNRTIPDSSVNCFVKGSSTGSSPGALIGGITACLAGIALIVFVIVFILLRKRRITKSDREKDHLTKRTRNDRATTDDEGEGLKDNILYVSADDIDTTETRSGYAEVKKPNRDTNAVYTEVRKGTNTPSKGDVYENFEMPVRHNQSEEMVINKNRKEKPTAEQYKKNKDGLIYADLDLASYPSGKKFVIHGIENRSNYAIIDLTKKADPLPSDDDDELQEEKTTHNNDNEVKKQKII